MKGLDWNAVRDELRPRAAAARTNAEERTVIEEMLSRLHESHYEVIPSGVVISGTGATVRPRRNSEPAKPPTPPRESPDTGGPATADFGFDVRPWGDRLLVSRVTPDGPAAKAGVAPGWSLVSVGDSE